MPYQIIANIITGINIISGLMAIFLAIHLRFAWSASLIVLAVFLDALDGKIARLNKSPSDFGKEFDSLSDLISFGIAPIVMIYSFLNGLKDIFAIICLSIYLLSGAFRLARFNVYTRQKQVPFFIGLPIPAAAGFLAGIILLIIRDNIALEPNILLILSVILALLMASRIYYPNSLVLSGMDSKKIIALGLAGILLLFIMPHIFIFGCFLVYLVASPFMFRRLFRNL